jgi:hypothetical protein
MEHLKSAKKVVKSFIAHPKTSIAAVYGNFINHPTVEHVYRRGQSWISKIPLEPVILLLLVAPLVMVFFLGKKSSNRAKYFSKKL